MKLLTGKVAIFTGASRGIGRAIAKGSGKDVAAVVVNYSQSQEAANEVMTHIQQLDGQAMGCTWA